MNEDSYFVISPSEGDTFVHQYSKEELLEKLAENYWGRRPMDAIDWAHASNDTNYWGKLLIIKGTIAKVTPPGDWRVE